VAPVLPANTRAGPTSPPEAGYVVAALVVTAVGALSVVAGWCLVPSAGRASSRPCHERTEHLPLALET
jgi:hypothetical protein